MIIGLRIGLVLSGLLMLYLGSGFLIDPASSGANFGLSANGAHGLTSLRADFTSFFGVTGICLIWGAWQCRRDPLIIGAALMLVTLAGRVIAYAIDGGFEGFEAPMVVEAIVGGLGLLGARMLPKAKQVMG
ncbi:MAG: DUF4345 family protein [Erythrobacter sp.]